MKRFAIALLLAGCAQQKVIPDEDFTDLAGVDQKSDSFSRKMRFLGALDPGQTRDVYYTKSPTFRGYTITGDGPVDLWVRSSSGDAVAWLLDSKFHVIAKNDDADDTTYDAHVTGTLTAGKTYYLAMRDYDYKSHWFAVSRTGGADELACTGSGSIAVIADECMDDGGKNAVGDALEVYCVDGTARFCLSGEACPWRNGTPAHDDGATCSRAGLGAPAQEADLGPDFMAHVGDCTGWQGHEWYFCDADAQIHFADDGVR